MSHTYKQVYSIGPGNSLDVQVLVDWKSRGWSERKQVAVMASGFMDDADESYRVQQIINEKAKVIMAQFAEEDRLKEEAALAEWRKKMELDDASLIK